VRDLFLSHGHLDHALGAPYLLSQRTLHHQGSTRIFLPCEIRDDLETLLRAAGRLERIDYRFELVPLAPGDRVELGGGLALQAFATDHVVPSLGMHLVRRRKKLKPELAGKSAAEIVALRATGAEVHDEREEIWLSYCGDTGARVWALAPRLPESRVLMLECTFLGDAQRGKGAAFGHLHLDDLAAHEERLDGHEAIILHHLSRRHTTAELRAEIGRRLPRLAGRIHLWGEVSSGR
jgi:ribonuclease Z